MDQEMYCEEILSGELSEGGCTREERNVKSVWKLLQRGERESKYSPTSRVDRLPRAFEILTSCSSVILERKRISVNFR